MSRASSEDQLNFLLSCVKHACNGKVDFVEVAQECGVVSKGAAAKRYERLLKGKGISPNGGPDPKPAPRRTSKVTKSKSKNDTPKPRSKQRKLDKITEKKQEEAVSTAKLMPEPLKDFNMEERDFAPENGPSLKRNTSIPISQDSHFELTQTDESTFDFDEFCSAEMFAHCASETREPSQEDLLVPRSFPYMLPAASAPVQGTPREESKMERVPERETVVIAD
ncbi:hypothetical protein EPUS_03821 [Endocarpon pusillum Z07020]|uniref:Myb-like DNA-binding domain-containing protein n=1 Tax=Endocarpon pusillum (strain Z07020 / HMAS-L-300199) TaxID=1263415 RepID=U1G953_ENDPU|nr:uncharacterized protein EPUS_03821 [Endocarpon pusillum Z07020]ERF74007.1 hypothetical protein EPUS_03821 [Endocarpon pusillum Z07020]